MILMTRDEQRYELVLKRLIAAIDARDDLLAFTRLMMPVPGHAADPDFSRYDAQRFHRIMCAGLEELEKGNIKRLIISLPPRHGKTQLASKMFPAWYMGRNPEKSLIFGTYNEKFGQDVGRAVRDIMLGPGFAQVFPDVVLKDDSLASDRLQTLQGGIMAFVGRGGTTTGRGGDVLIIDDPLKDRHEADSPTIRDTLWTWFTQVIASRLMDETGRIMLIQCMTGDTPVLMADGTERPLSDIRPGDQIATYEAGGVSVSRVKNWKRQPLPDCVFAIRMASGSTVKANERHPFLVDNDGAREWVRVWDLRPGHRIVSVRAPGAGNSVCVTAADSRLVARGSAENTTARPDGPRGFGPPRITHDHAAPPTCDTDTGSKSRSMTLYSWTRAGFVLSVERCHPAPTPERIGTENYALTTITPRGGSEDCFATTATSWLATDEQKTDCSGPLDTYEIVLDEIASITFAGCEYVFDVEVEGTANFIANGLVSHNTRWHQDDLVGRLTDPTNSYYDPEEAADWRIIDMPALAMDADTDPLKRKEGEPLWPGRFGRDFLLGLQRRDNRGFSALYQGRPSPAGGAFFSAKWIQTYRPAELPANLRVYAASDHAVSLKQDSDKTCLLVVGVDEDNTIWVLPDLVWRMLTAEQAVESMIRMMRAHKPVFWWAERSHISKSIGPFLRKRMMETKTFCSIIEMQPIADKQTRAQSIQGRMSMGKVRFPERAAWWPAARDQMLKFPFDAHDDFVDTLAYVGLGLTLQVTAGPFKARQTEVAEGTFGWMKMQREQAEQSVRLGFGQGGW
jgi:predicted phage terminase large subunit-like protein